MFAYVAARSPTKFVVRTSARGETDRVMFFRVCERHHRAVLRDFPLQFPHSDLQRGLCTDCEPLEVFSLALGYYWRSANGLGPFFCRCWHTCIGKELKYLIFIKINPLNITIGVHSVNYSSGSGYG